MHEPPALAREIGVARLWVKDEGLNPTASFKARGMSAAVTRAQALGVPGLVTCRRRATPARRWRRTAPRRACPCAFTHPKRHRSRFSRRFARSGPICTSSQGTSVMPESRHAHSRSTSGYFDVSTLREPYRIEGKKTMGIELAEQLGMAVAHAHHLSDRRWHRAHRNVEGVRRDARRGLARARHRDAAHGRGAGRRMRADRSRVSRGP